MTPLRDRGFHCHDEIRHRGIGIRDSSLMTREHLQRQIVNGGIDL
jgi:hypothetical protein